jgi:phage major head subunit gpT-like protein
MNPAIRAIFFEAYQAAIAAADWTQICDIVPSTTKTETYAWLGALPSMRLFDAERLPKGISEYAYTLTNKKYEVSIAVDRDAYEDDQFGQIKLRIQGLAREAARYKEALVMGALEKGISSTPATDGYAYDGAYMFGTSRTIGASGTIDNYDTGVLTAANLQTEIIKLMNFCDDTGKSMGLLPDTLVVSPTNMFVARELLNSVYFPDLPAATYPAVPKVNVLQGMLKLIVTPYISTTPARWFLLDTKHVPKPLILQMREDVTFDALEANSETGFMRDQYVYGVKMRCVVGYGLPQTAIAVSGS